MTRHRRGLSRTLLAGVLTTAALTALLVGWFGSGWAGMRERQRALRAAPRDGAVRAAEDAAALLAERLEEVRRKEAERPYYHYQSLYHDPRGAAQGLAVAPSPLAAGPDDPLVRAHFQIDRTGQVTMPVINDEVPELSQTQELTGNQQLRAEISKVSMDLRSIRVFAELDAARFAVQEFDRRVYVQNAMPAQAYREAQRNPQQAIAGPEGRVALKVGGFEWRQTPLGDETRLLALRHLDTPDGALTQGFVVSREGAEQWLAERTGRALVVVAEDPARAPDTIAARVPISGIHWRVMTDVQAEEARAARMAAALPGEFLRGFIPIALLAALCGALVVWQMARAERLARERAHFAAAAAHELRTPLAGLQLYGDMLAGGLGDPANARTYAARIAEEAARLGRVVSNVLGFSQLERGNLSVRATDGDAAAAAGAAADQARASLERAGVTLTVDLPDEPLPARFDADAVARILGNLLDNAEKYTRGGADRAIRLTAARAGGTVELAVIDGGPGVSARAARALFRPFSRGVDTDAPAGLGLGLALSRALARDMGGDLFHRPSPAGATFVLALPAV